MDAPTPPAADHPLTRRRLLAAAAASAAAARWPVRHAGAADGSSQPAKNVDARKAFFASSDISVIEIDLDKDAFDSLRKDRRKYVKAKVTQDGKTSFADVGVRIKGSAGSVRDVGDKPALTLNMDKFVDGQRFHGMDKWHLNNSVQDPSYTTDLLCSDLYRSAGIPTTLTTHARVTLNGKPQGLYVVKEGYDKGFLKAHFGNTTGNLYDGGFLQDVDANLQLDHGKADNPDRADLKALVAAAREQDKAKRIEKLEQVLLLDRFTTFMALEVLCWDWDGYPMQRNNYRLYFDPTTKKATFLPSGMDQMFGDPNGPLFPTFNGVVARKVVDAPEGRKRYLAAVRKLLDGPLRPDPLVKKLDEIQDRIRPALKLADAGAAGGLRGQVDRVRNGIRQRAKSIDEQLKREKA
jgi:spore coat protein H